MGNLSTSENLANLHTASIVIGIVGIVFVALGFADIAGDIGQGMSFVSQRQYGTVAEERIVEV